MRMFSALRCNGKALAHEWSLEVGRVMVDDAEREERLKEIHENHIRRVFRKKMLQRAYAVRASLLLWVTFVVSAVLA